MELHQPKAEQMNLELSSSFGNISKFQSNDALNFYSPIIEADEMRIQQILMILLANSLKFTESGSVNIFVEIESKEEETYLKVQV